MFFGQTFDSQDLIVIALLIVLEGVLSIDNALVLGLLAKRLPKHQQSKALTYGLVGAFIFRLIAIATATYLLNWRIVKLLGGGYLVYVAIKHFFFESRDPTHDSLAVGTDGHAALTDASGQPLSDQEVHQELKARLPVPGAVSASRKYPGFWSTVGVIELTDIAFAIDSILAAIALVGSAPAEHEGSHPKLWVVVTGGFLGVVLMRFAAVVFIKLLDRFPRFEVSAYLLVIVIGMKLVVDWMFNSAEHPHRVDFHKPFVDPGYTANPAFWSFWILMLICFAIGFIPSRRQATVNVAPDPSAGR